MCSTSVLQASEDYVYATRSAVILLFMTSIKIICFQWMVYIVMREKKKCIETFFTHSSQFSPFGGVNCFFGARQVVVSGVFYLADLMCFMCGYLVRPAVR